MNDLKEGTQNSQTAGIPAGKDKAGEENSRAWFAGMASLAIPIICSRLAPSVESISICRFNRSFLSSSLYCVFNFYGSFSEVPSGNLFLFY